MDRQGNWNHGTNFDDVECGPDEHFPSGDECRSDEDISNNDNSVEEVYAEPAATTKDNGAGIIHVKGGGDMCATGVHCTMKAVRLGGLHLCMNCEKKMHGALCGALWEERGYNCKVFEKDLTDAGKARVNARGAVICILCMKNWFKGKFNIFVSMK